MKQDLKSLLSGIGCVLLILAVAALFLLTLWALEGI